MRGRGTIIILFSIGECFKWLMPYSPVHQCFGVSLCGNDATAWRDFYFLNYNKKKLCLSASLVDFLHSLASSQQLYSRMYIFEGFDKPS